MSQTLTRRQFLSATLATMATTALAACGVAPTATPLPTPTPAAATATPVAIATATKAAAAAPTATPATIATATRPAAASPTATGATSGGTVTIGRDQEPDKLVSAWTPLSVASEVSVLVLDPLLTYNEKTQFVPYLAREVPSVSNGGISSDGLTYTLKLRNDVKWHDGVPFTAKDVLFTLNVINDTKNGARSSVPYKSVATPDDYTIVFTLAAPNVGFLDRISGVQPLPQHTLSGVTDWKTAQFFAKPYPGSGPFKFVEWQRGNYISVQKNPDYYRTRVNLDKIVYRVIPNDDARLTALKTGEIDLSFYLIGDHVPLTRQIAGITVTETPSFAAFFFIFNLRDPLWKDVRTRQALNYAIDKTGIVQNVIKGLGTPKDSVLPHGSPAYSKPQTQYPYDVAKARALLDEAGWKETTPGAVREAKGVTGVTDGAKLAWTVNNITGQAERLQICQIAQQQWKAIGAQVDINTVDVAAYVAANNSFKFTMDYGYLGVSPEPVQAGYWWQVKDSPNWHGMDAVYPQIDSVFAQAQTTLDQATRFKILADYQEKINQLAPDVWIYDRNWYDAAKSKLQNFKPAPFGIHTWNAAEWWIKQS